MEAGEYGLTRGTDFVAVCLEVIAVAGLMSISWCVFGGAGFFRAFFFDFFFLQTHTACCKYEAASCLIYLSTTNEARPREPSDRGRFLPLGEKSLFIPGCVQGAIIEFVCRCVRVCNIRRFC